MGQTTATVPEVVRQEIEARDANDDFDLPMLPDVALEVLQVCNSNDVDAQRVSDILHRDPSIAGNVLRVANSPLLGARMQITSLQQAVSRLGIRPLCDIVVAVSTNARMFEVPEKWSSLVEHDLRLKSLLTALFCKEIARHCRSNVETAFLQGLLHAMGKPVLMLLAFDLEKRGKTFSVEEIDATLREFHCAIGARVSVAWELAEPIALAIRHQEDWASVPDARDGAVIVDLAETFARLALGDASSADLDPEEVGAAAARLNIYPDELATLWDKREALRELAEAM